MRAAPLAAAVLLVSLGGCALVLGVDGYETAGTGSSSSGAGGGISCVKASDCPGQDVACSVRKCDGTCAVENLPRETPVTPDPSRGDCRAVACNGNGGIISVPDDTDLPKTADRCLLAQCNNGMPSFANQPMGTPCGATGATHCDGHGLCTGCLNDANCGNGDACFSYQCVSGDCIKTPIAGSCGPQPTCTLGVETLQNSCVNGFCVTSGTHVCSPYLCQGNVCGASCTTNQECAPGDTCQSNSCGAPAGLGSVCNGPSDCASGNCVESVCCNDPCAMTCSSCTAAGKGTGVDGICGPSAPGTSCGQISCTGDSLALKQMQCDGTMNCAEVDTSCKGYLCTNSMCAGSCNGAGDCAPGFDCASGICCPSCAEWLQEGATTAPCAASVVLANNLKACACSGNCDSVCPNFCAGIGPDGPACDSCLNTNCQTLYSMCEASN